MLFVKSLKKGMRYLLIRFVEHITLEWEADILDGKVLIQRDLCGQEKLAGRN